MSRIAVIGAGNIGRTVGLAWEKSGHEVVYAARNADPPETHPVNEALSEAEVVLLAVPGKAVDSFVGEYGSHLGSRIVIDATNRPGEVGMHNADEFADRCPGVRYMRAFNTLGWEVLADPHGVEMFWCGPDGEEATTVEGLIADVGLKPVRAGGLDAIDAVDGIGKLWMQLVLRTGLPRTTAFRLVDTAGN